MHKVLQKRKGYPCFKRNTKTTRDLKLNNREKEDESLNDSRTIVIIKDKKQMCGNHLIRRREIV